MAAPCASCRKREGLMKNDYLWDGSGELDHDLQRTEKLLAWFRHRREMPNFAVTDFLPSKPSRFVFFTSGWTPRFAAATLLLLALTVSGLLLRLAPVELSNTPAWDVARLSGAPRVGNFSLASDSSKARLRVGQLMVTDNSSRASLNVAAGGEIYVDPDSPVRPVQSRSTLSP